MFVVDGGGGGDVVAAVCLLMGCGCLCSSPYLFVFGVDVGVCGGVVMVFLVLLAVDDIVVGFVVVCGRCFCCGGGMLMVTFVYPVVGGIAGVCARCCCCLCFDVCGAIGALLSLFVVVGIRNGITVDWHHCCACLCLLLAFMAVC